LEAINIPLKKWIIKSNWYWTYTTGLGNTYQYYDYIVINENEERGIIKVGDFTCVEIGREEKDSGDYCSIYPKIADENGVLYKLKYETRSAEGIEILLPLIRDMIEITEAGSHNNWLLKKENQNLKLKISELETQINELQKKI
jgi:hypothetical protein